jgi:hypothetical protein
MSFMSLFRKPSPVQIAQSTLEEAQRTLLEISSHREYYAAMERMLIERIERLRFELRKDFNNDEEDFSGGRLDVRHSPGLSG